MFGIYRTKSKECVWAGCVCVGGGAFCGIPAPYQIFLFFAGEQQLNMCTLSWHTSARAEAGLFSSYIVLKVGGVIQYDTDE